MNKSNLSEETFIKKNEKKRKSSLIFWLIHFALTLSRVPFFAAIFFWCHFGEDLGKIIGNFLAKSL